MLPSGVPAKQAALAECPCCLERRPTPRLLACLHGLCEQCALDVAAHAAPHCPVCYERIADAAVLAPAQAPAVEAWRLPYLDRHLAVNAAGPPDPPPTQPAPADADSDSSAVLPPPVPEFAFALADTLLECSAQILAEAQDFATFTAENERRVLQSIADAYAPLLLAPGLALRREAFAAQARPLLAGQRKAAVLNAEAALNVFERATELVAHLAALRTLCQAEADPEAGPEARAHAHEARAAIDWEPRLNRLEALAARVDAYMPAPLNATFFACVTPLNLSTERHAHLARTLLWHERWSDPAFAPPVRHFRGATGVPAAATPDGRLVLGPHLAYTVPVASLAAGTLDGAATLALPDSAHFDLLQADATGHVWALWRHVVVRWAPSGAQVRAIAVADVTRLWNKMAPRHAQDIIVAFVLAPAGVLVLHMKAFNAQYVVALCSDIAASGPLHLLWKKHFDPGRHGVLARLCVAHGDWLLLHFGGTSIRAFDVHTGARRSESGAERWLPQLLGLPRRMRTREGARAWALDHLWPPERVRALWPEGAPAVPPVARVWRVCDFPQHAAPAVVGPLGRLYTGEGSHSAVCAC